MIKSLVLFSASLCVMLATAAQCVSGSWPVWLDRAPINIDSSFVGFPSAMGLSMAYRYLAYILNLAALAGLIHLFAREEVDYSCFLCVYIGILVGGLLLSLLLSPFLHAFALLPIVAFTAFLLGRFCQLSARKAILVAFAFHAFQAAYILAFGAISAKGGWGEMGSRLSTYEMGSYEMGSRLFIGVCGSRVIGNKAELIEKVSR